MYEQIFSIAAICLIAAAGACWSAVRKRSLKRQRLHEKYGKYRKQATGIKRSR